MGNTRRQWAFPFASRSHAGRGQARYTYCDSSAYVMQQRVKERIGAFTAAPPSTQHRVLQQRAYELTFSIG